MDFTLRPWDANDLESLVKHANNFEIARNLTNSFPHPYTIDNGKEFIDFATQHNPPNILAIDVKGNAIGGIGIHPQSDVMCKNAEIGYWLGQDYWGNGIISSAIKQMIPYAFKNWDITRIYGRCYGPNTASQKVLEKNGFKLEATFEKTIFKNGEFLDELVFAIRR